MSPRALLDSLTSPFIDHEEMWSDALDQALRLPRIREGDSAIERMEAFKKLLDAELVAFHERLDVGPCDDEGIKCDEGAKLWRVDVPLTLFPRRHHGFDRIECIVMFEGDGLVVRALEPQAQSEVMARASMGAKLSVAGEGRLRLSAAPTVAEAAQVVYAKAGADASAAADLGPIEYKAVRRCVETEIVNGIGARWRIEDERDTEKVGVEGHKLACIVQIADEAGPINAAGYLQAYSEAKWLTADLTTVWRELKNAIARFFARGAPAEAHAEWSDVFTREG